jgi:hypothetical protein
MDEVAYMSLYVMICHYMSLYVIRLKCSKYENTFELRSFVSNVNAASTNKSTSYGYRVF